MNYAFDGIVNLSIQDEVIAKFTNYMENNRFCTESGGIIIGTLNPAANLINVTDITEPQKMDRQGPFTFHRDEHGHQQIMDSLWEQSGRRKIYLGEWHTHNQDIPKPSYIDIRNWIKISERGTNSNWVIFIIVGKKEIGVWTVENGKIISLKGLWI